MKDDPREIDWPERHIKALEATVYTESGDDRIGEAHRRISDETQRLNSLRSGMHFLAGRTSELEKKTRELDEMGRVDGKAFAKHKKLAEIGWSNHSRLVGEVSETDRAVDAHNQRISRLEVQARDIVDRSNRFASTFDRMGDQLMEVESRIEAIRETVDGMTPYVELAERVKRLESQTQFETSEDDARLRAIEAALDNYGIPRVGRPVKVALWSAPKEAAETVVVGVTAPGESHSPGTWGMTDQGDLVDASRQQCQHGYRTFDRAGKTHHIGTGGLCDPSTEHSQLQSVRDSVREITLDEAVGRLKVWAGSRLWLDSDTLDELIGAIRDDA